MSNDRIDSADHDDEATAVDPPLALRGQPDTDVEPGRSLSADVKVVAVPCDRAPDMSSEAETPWQYVQVWTRKHIYAVDMAMTCIAVFNRTAGKFEKQHEVLGGRLAGGQLLQGGHVQIVCPLPTPGTQAVFELGNGRKASYIRTSEVEQVLVRLVVVSSSRQRTNPTWKRLLEWETSSRRATRSLR